METEQKKLLFDPSIDLSMAYKIMHQEQQLDCYSWEYPVKHHGDKKYIAGICLSMEEIKDFPRVLYENGHSPWKNPLSIQHRPLHKLLFDGKIDFKGLAPNDILPIMIDYNSRLDNQICAEDYKNVYHDWYLKKLIRSI